MTLPEELEWNKAIRDMQVEELLQQPDYLDDLVRDLRSENPALRDETARQIAYLGKPAATVEVVKALKVLLSDQDMGIRCSALDAIGSFGRAVLEHKGLLELVALKSTADSPEVARAAVEALSLTPWTLATGKDYTEVLNALDKLEKADTTPEDLRPLLSDALLAYRLEEGRVREKSRRRLTVTEIGNAIRNVVFQLGGGFGKGQTDVNLRPNDKGAKKVEDGNFEDFGIAWAVLQKESRAYVLFASRREDARGTVWRVRLSNGTVGFVLLSAPNSTEKVSIGYLTLETSEVYPEDIEPLTAFHEGDEDELQSTLRGLVDWDNRGLAEWDRWRESQTDPS